MNLAFCRAVNWSVYGPENVIHLLVLLIRL